MGRKDRGGAPRPGLVYAGVDTHAGEHSLAVVDWAGAPLLEAAFPADAAGYAALAAAASECGEVARVGVEGRSSYGAGLARSLRAAGLEVVEVLRPRRAPRPSAGGGKSDPADALRAAQDAREGAFHEPKSADGPVEALRALANAREALVRAATAASNAAGSMPSTAPEPLRARFAGLSGRARMRALAADGPGEPDDPLEAAVLSALRALAASWAEADRRASELRARMAAAVEAACPALAALQGVSAVNGADLLLAAGDNPSRLASEASWASLRGASPVEASSGRTARHRLNRGGNRRANRALHRIAVVRMGRDPRTRAYVERRAAEGKSKREAIRCLKRYIAREVYRAMRSSPPAEFPGATGNGA